MSFESLIRFSVGQTIKRLITPKVKALSEQRSAAAVHRNKNIGDGQLTSTNMCEDKTNKVPTTGQRRLAAFDFDYTVVAQNTDTVIRDLLPAEKLTKELNDIIDKSGWTPYMATVFQLLHENNITPGQIREAIRCIPEVPGFVRLLKRLHQNHNFDLIIISDSNSVFIAEWLEAHRLTECFVGIFTNPAKFEDDALLTIQPYHHQTDCRLSAANLCKGKVLEHFVVEQDLRHNLRYERVIYVGDGNNDICPVLRLRPGDIACARFGYAMEKNLEKNREKMKLRSELVIWKNGFDLLEQIEAILEEQGGGDDGERQTEH